MINHIRYEKCKEIDDGSGGSSGDNHKDRHLRLGKVEYTSLENTINVMSIVSDKLDENVKVIYLKYGAEELIELNKSLNNILFVLQNFVERALEEMKSLRALVL